MEKQQVPYEEIQRQEIPAPPYRKENNDPFIMHPNQSTYFGPETTTPQSAPPPPGIVAPNSQPKYTPETVGGFPTYQYNYAPMSDQQALPKPGQYPPHMMNSPYPPQVQQQAYQQTYQEVERGVGQNSPKKSNTKATIGGGLLGFALTGRISGAAGGAIIGNMYSKHRK